MIRLIMGEIRKFYVLCCVQKVALLGTAIRMLVVSGIFNGSMQKLCERPCLYICIGIEFNAYDDDNALWFGLLASNDGSSGEIPSESDETKRTVRGAEKGPAQWNYSSSDPNLRSTLRTLRTLDNRSIRL
mmetsp:Transcript_15419/g.29421  ORF Transcript_15419/g.29421 Transcript_15419/m.29421 type:complete len:130 (+) Transcript_15419:3-392(+)